MREQHSRAEQLGVRTVPTFIFYSQGEEIRRRSGNLSESEIKYMFRPADSLF